MMYSDEPFEFEMLVHKANILNSNDRGHTKAKMNEVRTLRQLGIIESRKLPMYRRVRCFVEVSYPDRRHRDASNLHATLKPLVDGFVNKGAGMLPDDNDRYLSGPFPEWSGRLSPKKDHFHFRFRFEPMDPLVVEV